MKVGGERVFEMHQQTCFVKLAIQLEWGDVEFAVVQYTAILVTKTLRNGLEIDLKALPRVGLAHWNEVRNTPDHAAEA